MVPPRSGSSETPLRRTLDVWDTVSLVVGSVIGAGIFLVPHQVAGFVASPSLMLSIWVVAGMVSLFGALVIGELGSQFPRAGGLYVFLREAYGPLMAFLYGWSLLLAIQTGNIASLGAAFLVYFSCLIPVSPMGAKALGVAVIAFLTAGNCLGVRRGAWIQNWLTVTKAVTVGGVILVLLSAKQASRVVAVPESQSLRWSSVGLATIVILWAYEDWHLASFAAGEIICPQRNLPRGMILGVGFVIVLYVAANAGYLHVLPLQMLRTRPDVAAAAMERVVGRFGGTIVSNLILLSVLGAMNGLILSGPRVYYAMAQDGCFFRQFAKVSKTHRVPVNAILLQGALASLMVVVRGFAQLVRYVIFAGWIFYALAVVGLWRLRGSPGWNPAFRCPAYLLLGCAFVLFAMYVVWSQIAREPREATLGLGVILLGIPIYGLWRGKKPAHLHQPG
jgi:APA family basic amino acid/polyamine antiporter